jgi:hypothetical protein
MVSKLFSVGPAVLMYSSPDPILVLEQYVRRLCTERLSAGPDSCLPGYVFPTVDWSTRGLEISVSDHNLNRFT